MTNKVKKTVEEAKHIAKRMRTDLCRERCHQPYHKNTCMECEHDKEIIKIRPFFNNEGYIVKLEVEHNQAGHDHLHILDQKGKRTIGYFHLNKKGFSFCSRSERKEISDIHYYFEQGLV